MDRATLQDYASGDRVRFTKAYVYGSAVSQWSKLESWCGTVKECGQLPNFPHDLIISWDHNPDQKNIARPYDVVKVPSPYQPKTGATCSCRKGMERDNCPRCEGTGMVIDFARIRGRQ